MSKTKSFTFVHGTYTLPSHISEKLEAINQNTEENGKIAIGRSFIIRFALEELFKRSDVREALIERKIDALRAKELA